MHFPDTGTQSYSAYIHASKYARWRDEDRRRETWPETVARYIDFFRRRLTADGTLAAFGGEERLQWLSDSIERMDVMPSMRALWSAGPALERCNVASLNCAYAAVDSPRVFDEALYILMSGCGLGFSVERQYINQLPTIPPEVRSLDDERCTIVVEDSREGWALAFRGLLGCLYSGIIPAWDLSQLRPAGARLYTSGGRSSGPEPLDKLFCFTVDTFKQAAGRKLSSIECHDLMCTVGSVVVAGGVRRSALISLSNPSDDRMRHAKDGQWYLTEQQRQYANNSAAYTEAPEVDAFMREWLALYESKSGERGIFNRVAAQRKAERLGRKVADFGTNPCGEISLRSMQFCNLSEVVVRAGDTLEQLAAKVEAATLLGTLQSMLTDFGYLRDTWRRNCEDERLLGVSLTGITDHVRLGDPDFAGIGQWLTHLRTVARTTNATAAKALGIRPSAAITTVKPSGTVSQLVNSASGIHARFSPRYIRRTVELRTSPIARFMIDAGYPHEPHISNETLIAFTTPVAAPPGSRCVADCDALTQVRLWHTYATHWADHSVSATINYHDHEFPALGAWVWEHFDSITGLAFLPVSGHSYKQPVYEEIDEETYRCLVEQMPADVDWTQLAAYEDDDNTTGAKTLACSSGACDIVGLEG